MIDYFNSWRLPICHRQDELRARYLRVTIHTVRRQVADPFS